MSENNFDKTIESPYSDGNAKLKQKPINLIKDEVKKSIQTFYYECIETKKTFTTEVLEDYNLKLVNAAFKKEENKTDIGGMKENNKNKDNQHNLIDYKNISTLLHKFEEDNKINGETAAEIIGISKSTYYQLASGKSINNINLEKVLKTLNYSLILTRNP